MQENRKDLNYRITDDVRAQIAFEVFRTTPANRLNFRVGSYMSIGRQFGCSKTTVKVIAREYGVDRNKKFIGESDPTAPRTKYERDIAKVNWTFNPDLKLVRVKRRENELVQEVHESMKKLAELS